MVMIAEATPSQIEAHRAHVARLARFRPVPKLILVNVAPVDRWPDYAPTASYDHYVPEPEPVGSWRHIIRTVAKKHRLTLDVLLGPSRARKVVAARQEAFYRLGHETRLSLPQIGARMNRDHTTVLHGIRRHARVYGLENVRTA